MKIALIGTRGIPANHGGYETCVEEIGQRLVNEGHRVFVYSQRCKDTEELLEYKGMRIIYIPRLKIKGLETLLSTFVSVLHSFFMRYDIHMVFNVANSPTLVFYYFFNKKYALNTDGLEWQRDKWGIIGKNYYKVCERIAVRLCKNLVSDSQGIHDYYKRKYNTESTTIAYGASFFKDYSGQKYAIYLNELGLIPKNYILQITRFEPENNPLLTLRAFIKLKLPLKLVLVGGAKYPTKYLKEIEVTASQDANVILPGFIYNKEKLYTIWQNALCYIHGNSVGGTNPALLQAMAAGRPILAIDCIFNREVLNNNGYFFSRNIENLSNTIDKFLQDQEQGEYFALQAKQRVSSVYTWDIITKKYEYLFNEILNK